MKEKQKFKSTRHSQSKTRPINPQKPKKPLGGLPANQFERMCKVY